MQWGQFSYISVPFPRQITGGRLSYMEHGCAGLASTTEITDTDRYNAIITKNLKFTFFLSQQLLQRGVTGFSTNTLADGPASIWSQSWEFLSESNCDLEMLVSVMCFETDQHIMKFFNVIREGIGKFVGNLKLNDNRAWLGENAVLIGHLRTWIALLAMSHNLSQYAYRRLWADFVRVKRDFARLCDTVIKK